MKKILFFLPALFLLSFASLAAEHHWPKPVGYVNDFAEVIPQAQAAKINRYLRDLEKSTTAQVVVVTVPRIKGGDINEAAADLFKTWGIGQKGKDNGVLILAAIKDRKVRIEVGYGMEGTITDGDAGDIIRYKMAPSFKEGNYGTGLSKAAHAIGDSITQYGSLPASTHSYSGSSNYTGNDFQTMIFLVGIVVLLVVVFVAIASNSGTGSGYRRGYYVNNYHYWGGSSWGGGSGGGSGGSSWGGGSSGGSSSSSGSSGGFSGGGGSSGGGGATGSW